MSRQKLVTICCDYIKEFCPEMVRPGEPDGKICVPCSAKSQMLLDISRKPGFPELLNKALCDANPSQLALLVVSETGSTRLPLF